MVSPFLSSATATKIRALAQRGQATTAQFFTDTYAAYEVNRPEGWATGTVQESDVLRGTGTGKLRANGAGGPQAGEHVITIESPYVFRTWAAEPIQTGDELIVNGDRIFRVDLAKREGDDDLLMDVYCTEIVEDAD